MLKNAWTFRPEPILPAGYIEDFAVTAEPDGYRAWYCQSASNGCFQDLRLTLAWGASPTGPFESPARVNSVGHTRLYRGKLVNGPVPGMIVTAVWPGLPRAGLWHFLDLPGTQLTKKELLLAPEPNTGYSIAVANPCVIWDGKHYNIFFEGRAEEVRWKIFHAVWDGHGPAQHVGYICDGANPSIAQFNGVYYLYYSAAKDGMFETRVATMNAEGAVV